MSSVDLLTRLGDERERVRRLAALDLSNLPTPELLEAAGDHLERGEPDEKTAITLIRALGRARHGGAQPILKRLYDEPSTPVRVAHAAILAHDAIDAERVDAA